MCPGCLVSQTPGMPKFLIVRPLMDREKVSAEDQQEYWLGVGMLLYLVKHSCPNLANIIREHSKAKDDANPAAHKELLWVIKYVLDTKSLGLKVEPMGNSNEPWEIVCFSSSNYEGDLVSRRRINGFILYALGIPVSWQSKSQKSVSFSTSKVEWGCWRSDVCNSDSGKHENSS